MKSRQALSQGKVVASDPRPRPAGRALRPAPAEGTSEKIGALPPTTSVLTATT